VMSSTYNWFEAAQQQQQALPARPCLRNASRAFHETNTPTPPHLNRRRRPRRHSTTRHRPITTTRSVPTTHTTTHRILVRNPAILINRRRRLNLAISSRINPNTNPRHNPIGDIVAELHPLDERIHVRGFLGEDLVVGVEGDGLRVGVVGRGGFDEGEEGLVEEELADVGGVGGGVVFEESAVGADEGGGGVVGEDVDVGGACFEVVS